MKNTTEHKPSEEILRSLKENEVIVYDADYWGIYDASFITEECLVHSTDSPEGLLLWAEERRLSEIYPNGKLFKSPLDYLESLLKPSEVLQYGAGQWEIYDGSEVLYSTEDIEGIIHWAEERQPELSKSSCIEIKDILQLLNKDETLVLDTNTSEFIVTYKPTNHTILKSSDLYSLFNEILKRNEKLKELKEQLGNLLPVEAFTLTLEVQGGLEQAQRVQSLIDKDKAVLSSSLYEH